MIPEAQVSHQMSYRIRIKIPSKKGNDSYFSNLKETLSKYPGVTSVVISPERGSVLILHECDVKELFAYAKNKGLFVQKVFSEKRKSVFNSIAGMFQNYNYRLRLFTNGALDIPSLVFLSLVASGMYQIARGKLSAPAWYTAFYYALGVFTRARVEEFDEGENFVESVDNLNGENGE